MTRTGRKLNGVKKEFKNQTEFRGRGKKIGGWLGELNETRIEKGARPGLRRV